MRKGTKMLVTASVFAVAMNANACMYGPPEGYTYIPPTKTPVVELHQPTSEAVETPVEPATWYMVTMGRYAVIRMLSVPGVDNLQDKQNEDVVCGIEVLSAYNVEENLNTISEILIPAKDSSLFSEGDVLFVELGRMVHRDGEDTYRIADGDSGAVFAPYKENRLVLSEEFRKTSLFDVLWLYNAQIEQYEAALEMGEEFYMEFKAPYFDDGLTTEETELFFENLKDAKKAYEVVLEKLRKEMMGGSENE